MLTSLERTILDFERCWWQLPGPKDRDIRVAFGFGPARYYRLLKALMDDPAALAYDPLTVHRLRRIRPAPWTRPDTGGYGVTGRRAPRMYSRVSGQGPAGRIDARPPRFRR